MQRLSRIFAILILAFLPAHPAPAKVVYVAQDATGYGSGSSWGNACTTITAGLAVSASGDEIWVKSATYPEAIEMKEGVALCGGFPTDGSPSFEQRDWRANETIIDATGLNSSVVVGADFAILDGFFLIGGSAELGGGIYCEDSSPTIRHCRIIGNTARWGGGGHFRGDASPTLANCLIARNRSTENSAGLSLNLGATPILINCTLVDNRVTVNPGGNVGGIRGGGEESRLVNCILWNEGWDLESFDGKVRHSCIPGSWPGEGNFGADPEFVDPEVGDYRLRNGSRCIDRGLASAAPTDDLEGNLRPGSDGKVDIGTFESPPEYEPVPPQVYYVRADAREGGDGLSWATALRSIQAALDNTSPLDEVWVAQGRYQEMVTLVQDRAIYGGFAGDETDRDQRDFVLHESIIDSSGIGQIAVIGADQARLDGFTVTADENHYTIAGSGTAPTIENTKLDGGQGAFFRTYANLPAGYNPSPLFINCTVTGCVAGYGLYFNTASPTLVSCTISENVRGIRFFYSPGGKIINCTIANNSSDGVVTTESKITLDGCRIINNQKSGVYNWGIFSAPPSEDTNCLDYSITVINCVLAGNGEYALYCLGTSPILRYCTIADNTPGGFYVERNFYIPYGGAGGFWECDELTSLSSCIVWNDNPFEVHLMYYEEMESGYEYDLIDSQLLPHGQGADIEYSSVTNNWPGVGNIGTNPLFVNPAAGDYRLLPGSPCIDNASTSGPDRDLDGNHRPIDVPGIGHDGPGAYDMGAYEFDPSNPPPTPTSTPTPTMTSTPTLSPTPTGTPGPPTETPTALPSTTPIPGDLNNDGTVNQTDLLLFQEHWHKSITPIPGA